MPGLFTTGGNGGAFGFDFDKAPHLQAAVNFRQLRVFDPTHTHFLEANHKAASIFLTCRQARHQIHHVSIFYDDGLTIHFNQGLTA